METKPLNTQKIWNSEVGLIWNIREYIFGVSMHYVVDKLLKTFRQDIGPEQFYVCLTLILVLFICIFTVDVLG